MKNKLIFTSEYIPLFLSLPPPLKLRGYPAAFTFIPGELYLIKNQTLSKYIKTKI